MASEADSSWGKRLDEAIQAGVAKALAEHKRAGRSIAIWKDGKVVIIPPEKIKVPRIRRSKNRLVSEL